MTALIRLILYGLVAYLALRFVVRLLRPAKPRAGSFRGSKSSTGRMIRCEACGTFVAEKSALLLGGKGFCSVACVDRVAKAGA